MHRRVATFLHTVVSDAAARYQERPGMDPEFRPPAVSKSSKMPRAGFYTLMYSFRLSSEKGLFEGSRMFL